MPEASARQELGRLGEKRAAEFLQKQGYHLVAANLRLKCGEIDLLMQEGDTVVIVEVKTQGSARFSHPVFKVDRAKQRKLWQLAQAISQRYPEQNIRLDVVTIYWCNNQVEPEITHWKNILS